MRLSNLFNHKRPISQKLLHRLTRLFAMHPFSTPGKHQKTIRFFALFWGLRKGALGTNGLKQVRVLLLAFFRGWQ